MNNSEVTWEKYSETEYDQVTEASAKKALDLKIAGLVTQLNKDNTEERIGPVRVGELGCGPAPVSSILEKFNSSWVGDNPVQTEAGSLLGKPLFETVGFDNSSGMTNKKEREIVFEKADICDPFFADIYIKEGKKLFDTLVLENAWYATTTGIGKDLDESLYRRNITLYNAWKLLKEDGTLIISDPLSSTKDLSLRNTAQGAMKEIMAAIERGEIKESVRNIQNPVTKEAIARNKKEILPNSQLFSFEEMKEFINKSGLFTIEQAEKGDYLGHNATLVLRKINKKEMNINGTYALNILSSKAKDLLSAFRRVNYSEKVNPIVTGIDPQDYRHKESLTVVASLTGTNVPGAIATFDIEKDYDEDSWEFAELFDLPEDFAKIIPENRKTGEIRRLGTISAYGQEHMRIALGSITKVVERIYKEVIERDVGVLFFTATPDRLGLFNGILKRLGLSQFQKVDDVNLDRKGSSSVRTIITGAKYFLTDEGFSNLEKDRELSDLREFLIQNKESSLEEALKSLWPNRESAYEDVLRKIQDKEIYPENVSLYYAHVPQNKDGSK